MSNNKQSSVEWFLDELIKEGYIKRLPVTQFKQAKAMHKEEIEDAYWEGGQDVPSNEKQCQDYYKEKFGGNNEQNTPNN